MKTLPQGSRWPDLVSEAEARGLWTQNHLKPSVSAVYSRWIRSYSAYCGRCHIDPVSGLTASGAKKFFRWYVRIQRLPARDPADHLGVTSALRAYAWVLATRGIRVPEWKAADRKATSSAIVEAYLKHALERRGLSASSLHRDRSELDHFVADLRARHISWAQVGVRDFDRYHVTD